MSWWLRKLLRDYREDGCPPADRAKTDEDFEEPCRLCAWTDAALADEHAGSLDWQVDGEVVAETVSGCVALCLRDGAGWRWTVEHPQGWASQVQAQGTAATLVDALIAAEKAAAGV